MKKITLIIFLLCMSTILLAQENRKISDLMYFPRQEQFFILSEFSISRTSYTATQYYGGNPELENKQTRSTIDTSMGIGLLNNLYFAINFDYELYNKRTQDVYYGSTTETLKRKGFGDPRFEIGIRLLEQPNFPFTIDIYTLYSPKFIDAKQGSKDNEGNNGRGGREIDAGIGIGKKFKSFEFATNISYYYFGERKVEDLGETYNNTIIITGGNLISASLDFQNNIINNLYFRYGIFYLYKFKEELTQGYDTQKNDPVHTYGLNIGLSYTFIAEKLNAFFNYGYAREKDHESTVNYSYNYIRTKNYQMHLFLLGVIIQI